MKYIKSLIIFIFSIIFLLYSPYVRAEQTCHCTFNVSGLLCNGETTKDISIGKEFKLSDIIAEANFGSLCPKTNIVNSLSNQDITITAELCPTLSTQGSQMNHTYNLSCTLEGNLSEKNSSKNSNVSAVSATCGKGKICLENPIITTDITKIMGNLIKIALSIMGSLALLVFIIGGFMWMTAAGSPDKVKKGTQAMMWAVIGIIVIFSSYAIIKLVLKGIGANPDTSGSPAQTTEKLNWCLTAEGSCIEGGGGACSGNVYATEELCNKALNFIGPPQL